MSEEPRRKVGYKRPPVEHQFKKGEPSANPKGRPRKDKAFQQRLVDQVNRKVTMTLDGKRRRVAVEDLYLRQLCNKALGGNVQAIKELNKLRLQITPLKPEPEMSAEEMRVRKESAEKLSALLVESLERKAAENKPERPRPPPKPPEDGGEGEGK